LQGVQVGGKTGTAEVTDAESHAWFVAFAPAEDPSVVVAVIIENGGTGGTVAAPVVRKVLAAALGR
jgi:peptidoglycan glycosyltransferase